MAEPDVLGAPYTAETLHLRPDDEGEVVATLVRRPARAAHEQGRAARPRLRRLLLPDRAGGLLGRARLRLLRARPAQVRPLAAPAPDRQLRRRPARPTTRSSTSPSRIVTEDHDHVVLSAHSTGGLTVPLWLHDRGFAGCGRLPQRAVDRHARRRVHPADGAAGHPPARGALPDARDPARGQRRLRARACTGSTAASGTSTSTGSRSRPGRCTPGGSARSAPDRPASPVGSRSTPPS